MTEPNAYQRPSPLLNEDNSEFWSSCRSHRMALQQCDQGHFRYAPSPICPYCGSFNFAWTSVSGQAVVYSFTVVHRPPTDAWDVPYVFALVQLAEGALLPTNIVNCNPDDVSIGMKVRLIYDDVSPELTIPKFEPR